MMNKIIKLILLFNIFALSEAVGQEVLSDNIRGGAQGGLVGTIADSYDITPNGQFSYTMPIKVPYGSGGMMPQLSISYNSANKVGLAGYGFDLTGISVISRSPQNLHRDGKADVVRFTSNDRFSLDGMRLSEIRVVSDNKKEYRTEVNSHSRIVAQLTDGEPEKFIVYTKDGLIREFEPAKKILRSAGKNLYWLETKVSDTKGNYYTIYYSGDVNTNEFWPIRINYTSNESASLPSYFSIQFAYNKVTGGTSYVSGEKVSRTRVLKSIGCFYINSLIKRYDFEYTSARGKSFLHSIMETAGNEKHNPTVFNWRNNGSCRTVSSFKSSSSDFSNRHIITGDFNGDGRTDFITRANNNSKDLGYKLYVSKGNTFVLTASGSFVVPADANPSAKRIEQVKTGDFNGDGYDDVVVERANSPFYALDLYITHVLTDGKVSLDYERTLIKYFQMVHTMTVMDANRDGAADLFIREANYGSTNYITLMSQSTDSTIRPLAQQYEGNIDGDAWEAPFTGSVHLIDLDGDGTPEILNVRENYSVLYLMQPSGDLKKEKAFSLKASDYFNIGDFNGDGKADVMIMGSATDEKVGWEINYSTGLTANESNTFEYENVNKLFNPREKVGYVADIDNDGFDDFYVVNLNGGSSKQAVEIYINDGTGKNFSHFKGDAVWGNDKRNHILGDFNGDGDIDILSYPKLKDSASDIEVLSADITFNNLLASVTNGLGATVDIEYKLLTDPNIHKRGKRTEYPVVSVACAWPVVSSLSELDGIGGKRKTDYYYSNLQLHKRGRGILGLENITSIDRAINAKTETTYEMFSQEYLPVVKSQKTSINGRLQAEKVFTNSIQFQYNSNRKEASYTCLPVTVMERTYDYATGDITSDITTRYTYDKFGNPTLVKTTDGSRTITTTNEYMNDESRWLLGRLKKSSVEKNDGAQLSVITSEFEYDEMTGLLTRETFAPESPKGYSRSYTYDKFGNIIEDILQSNSDDSKPRITRTDYTSFGRFKYKTTNSLGHTSTSKISTFWGAETSSTDPNGLVTTYELDAFGNPVTSKTAIGESYKVSAWSNGHPYSPTNSAYYIKTYGTGIPTEWKFFDLLGRIVRKAALNPSDKVIFQDTEYNSKGEVVRSSEPYFMGETPVWNTFEYDAAGRVVKEQRADGGIYMYGYSGLTTTVTDPLGHTMSKTYDRHGNLVKSIDTLGNSVNYKYNVNDKCVETVGPRTAIKAEYDELGNRIKLDDPDLGVTEYEYNSFGELISQTDSKGKTTFTYDQGGRLIEECRPDGTYTYVYDTKRKGLLSSSSCDNGTGMEYSYDQYGRIIRETETVGKESFTTSYTYNALGKLDVMTYPSGLQVKNDYSAQGYLTSVRSNGADKVEYWKLNSSNARGQVTKSTLGNGLMVQDSYDISGRITEIRASGSFHKSYTYDAAGNLKSRRDEVRGMEESFEYDALNRLTKVKGAGTEQTVNYDNAGNVTFKTGVGTLSYKNGTNKINTISGGKYTLPEWSNIEYTSFNKIADVKRSYPNISIVVYDELELTYGADKNRKHQRISHFARRRFDEHIERNPRTVIEEKYYVGKHYEKVIRGATVRHVCHIYAGDIPVAIYETDGDGDINILYVHQDHLGSVAAYSDAKGKIVEELSYDAWGRRRKADTWEYFDFSDADITDYANGFTGHEHIDLFDMVNMDGRMYDAVVGRFLSPDPYIQEPSLTQSLNRYAYCINNPLSLTDPTGYNWIGDTFATLVGIAVGIETGGLATGIWGAVIGGSLGGASSSLLSSVFNGVNFWQAAKNTFTGAFWGAASGAANYGIGCIRNPYLRIGAHSISEGAMEGIRGGHIEHGLLMGLASSGGGELLSSYGGSLSYAEQVVANAVLGGVVSELGGGKFANGAMTAAYTMMFNDLAHKKKNEKTSSLKGDSYALSENTDLPLSCMVVGGILLSDDATLIGLLDDPVAIGLLGIGTIYYTVEYGPIIIATTKNIFNNVINTSTLYSEHKKNARPSSKNKHQLGQSRRQNDMQGGEKGDKRRKKYK